MSLLNLTSRTAGLSEFDAAGRNKNDTARILVRTFSADCRGRRPDWPPSLRIELSKSAVWARRSRSSPAAGAFPSKLLASYRRSAAAAADAAAGQCWRYVACYVSPALPSSSIGKRFTISKRSAEVRAATNRRASTRLLAVRTSTGG